MDQRYMNLELASITASLRPNSMETSYSYSQLNVMVRTIRFKDFY